MKLSRIDIGKADVEGSCYLRYGRGYQSTADISAPGTLSAVSP